MCPMNLKITTDSLAQVLREFQMAPSLTGRLRLIAPLLELGKVDEWDSITLLKREKKIRESALILGGKCIAILLKKLSYSHEVCSRAINQTQGWWRKKTGKNGSKKCQILTIGNVIVDLKLPYVVERKTRKDYQNKPKGQGFCPFLRWLGIEKKVTPLVWSTVAEYGTMRSSFETAKLTLKDWGIALSIRRISRLTYRFCEQALSQRRSKIFNLQRGNLGSTNILKGKRVVISIDGGRTRLIDYQGKDPIRKLTVVDIKENGKNLNY